MKTWILKQATFGKTSHVVGYFLYDEESNMVLYKPNGAEAPVSNELFLVMWGNSYMVPRISGFVTLKNPKNYFDKLPERFRGRLFISAAD